ncbi:hypothetical protein [Mycolicibacterium vaccae]|uniref:Methyltransferase family protein n=1 Tax=Mycolicibacterium vaccae ATCC 25954 TaxID=1194972 RepID=K0UX26_MYCVA|nr:hypothetical protein [Mycolicibacterium vaccae]EJZ11336.1 methyltransferase family protein [Mycolicibacterium vaccae ATCC 25954]MCV7061973.1 hypothetical protein [Mycolicibacterium vaccae]
MGIGYLGARLLWDAKRSGVCFDEVLTLGRQSLRLFPSEVSFFQREYRQHYGVSPASLDNYRWGDYLDGFLRDFMEAKSITVLDASPYQGADTIHDMNEPVPESWHSRYDSVIDGGSLEHIFDISTSFANLADMLKVGGTIFTNSPANNLMGHGFYQFSPEFMFRVFSSENGFQIDHVMLYEARYPGVELTKKSTIYSVVDPNQVRQRVGLLNKKPVMMMVQAKKIDHVKMFSQPPLQSDYVTTWGSGASSQPPSLRLRLKDLIKRMPLALRAPIEGARQKRKFSFSNSSFYLRERWRP